MPVCVAVDRLRPCTPAELLAFHCTQTKGSSPLAADAQTQHGFIDERAPLNLTAADSSRNGNVDEYEDERDDEMSEPTQLTRTEKAKEIQTDKTAKELRAPLPTADSSHASSLRPCRWLCEYWGTIFQPRAEGPKHHQYENILRYVQNAPDDIRWIIDEREFDELMATKKESSPDGIPYSFHRCAGGLGSQVLFNAYKRVLVDGTIPALFAESRTVFIPKSSHVDNDGRIVRSPEALRPLTLCNCDCKILTLAICTGLFWYTMRCIHSSQRCISSRQVTDNIFEIETTALAHLRVHRESNVFS